MTLTVSDLTIARGGIRVLAAVSFAVQAGQALVLRGPNGIGKTTLLRTITGLQPPVGGQVSAPPESMAYAGHADGIKATLTVEENLRFWALIFGGHSISPALEAFDLTSLRNRPAGQLSAGQKRRLGLARLLVAGRPLWLLDEPTVSLDTKAVEMFSHVIADHLANGGIALLATHIDLGLEDAADFDLTPYRARPSEVENFDEAFL